MTPFTVDQYLTADGDTNATLTFTDEAAHALAVAMRGAAQRHGVTSCPAVPALVGLLTGTGIDVPHDDLEQLVDDLTDALECAPDPALVAEQDATDPKDAA